MLAVQTFRFPKPGEAHSGVMGNDELPMYAHGRRTLMRGAFIRNDPTMTGYVNGAVVPGILKTAG